METKAPKNVGEVFEIRTDAATRQAILAVARVATFAENAIWDIYRRNDPLTPTRVVEMQLEKDRTGKYPKLPPFDLKDTPDGATPTKILGALCPGLSAYVYDAIAHRVGTLYRKNAERFAYAFYRKRLPVSNDLRIRFRERAVRIVRHPENKNWFRAELTLYAKGGQKLMVDLLARGKSDATLRWLAELADTGAHPSGGTISARRKHGHLEWQISFSRCRQPGERARVHPIDGRKLVVYAPLEQDVFLRCRVEPVKGRPWVWEVESNDLSQLQRRYQALRVAMGRNYHQSPDSGAHGHGRRRAICGKERLTLRYENRVKDWIENRSAALVAEAIRRRCGRIEMEDLSARNPELLRLGRFPYYRLLSRIEQKAKDAGIEFEKTPSLSSMKDALVAAVQ
jgi:hypothetical protein